MTSDRALRVALIFNGRIVEDRTLPQNKMAAVSVGSAPTNTFCVPMGELPAASTLFSVRKDGAVTLMSGAWDGRMTLGGQEQPLPKEPLVLDATSKGRIRLGDVTVLFQLVKPLPEAAPPELPKGARGVVAQLDRSFMVALALSFAANLAGAGYVIAQPIPEAPDFTLEDLQLDRHAAVMLPMPKPPAAPELPASKEPAAEPAVAAKPPSPTPTPAPPSRPAPASRDQLERSVAKFGMLKVIGSIGEEGVVGDLLEGANAVGNVADALKDAKTVSVGSAEDAVALRRRGDDPGRTESVGPIGTDGVRDVRLQETGEREIAVRVQDEPVHVDTPDVPPKALAKWMKGRRSAITSCYERELKRNRQLAGRLVLAFSITPRGRVADLDFSEGTLRSSPVESCIGAVAKNWVLPFSPEDDVRVEFPFIFSPVN
jgi:hypothetical protein